MPDAALVINGTRYLGWTEVGLSRSMEQLVPTFDIAFTEVWSQNARPVPIDEGAACVLQLGDRDVVNGYIDDVDGDYDATTHTLRVAGRAKTCDLVDCSAIHGGGEWHGRTLLDIALDLCRPFGLAVDVQTSVGASFDKFKLQDSETVYEALERACRMRGVLMMTSGSGDLVFTRAGARRTRTALRRGENIVKGGWSASARDRFDRYIVKAQLTGTDEFFGDAAVTPKRIATDGDVRRYRPLVVMAEDQATGQQLQERANWERNVRAGRGRRLRYTVQGWENAEGLWEPNVRVRVIDPFARVDAEVMVISVRQTKGASGTQTELELGDPRALSPQPVVPKQEFSFL